MHIVRYVDPAGRPRVGATDPAGGMRPLPVAYMSSLLCMSLVDMRAAVEGAFEMAPRTDLPNRTLPPVDGDTEVWASGVTYRRSRQARVEESHDADVYTRVYGAERPELFFKSVAWRVVGDGDPVGVRADSPSNTPEPELALVLNSGAEIVGITICNDVSSRSIEGENPLYLPQAKIYTGSCALGPGIRPIWEVADLYDLAIRCAITRGGDEVWSAETTTSLLNRRFDDLVEHLFRAMDFPRGVVLSTGTGIVPELDTTLTAGDVVRIEVESVGVLTNAVICVP